MEQEFKVVNGIIQMQLTGKIYVERATKIREQAFTYFEQGYKDFIIDLGEVEHIDSTGLGVLIAIQKRSVQNNGNVTLKNVKGTVKQLFELTRLTKVFHIE